MFCIALRVVLIAGIIQFIVAACPDGWQQHGLSCYHFSHDREEWTGAFSTDQKMSVKLAASIQLPVDYTNGKWQLAANFTLLMPQMCQIMGGHLVEIDDLNENKYLTEQVKNIGRVHWIGLSDVSEEGTWVWMTSKTKNTNDQYSNWVPGEPSSFDTNHEPENCANFYATGQWNDAHCTQYNYYICETEVEQPEIVG